MLYMLCGWEVLQRDLECLCWSPSSPPPCQRQNEAGGDGCNENRIEVIDCVLLDLFPGTDAVESLVHLWRRRKDM